jgi:hypothetical protein|tara:strand:+ start:1707 stop:1982 length:276 start_codon:yes stop_codon:yes gene_type:complete
MVNNNKLIAEFMGNIELEYQTSWDCLMPVANEIIRSRNENNANWNLTILENALTTTNIGLVYNAVVDFITNEEYKKTFRYTAYNSLSMKTL